MLYYYGRGEQNMKRENFDVAVSYASEQRSYVERFVKRLSAHKLQVYYDRNEQSRMTGKILDQELHKVYIQQSEHCILFLSTAYIEKPVTRYESQIILSETLFKDGFMYVFKFNDVTIPGLNRNFVYSSIQDFPEPEQYADFIYQVIRGKAPKCSSGDFLYQSLSGELTHILKHYAQQFGFVFQEDKQANKILMRLQSGLSVLIQLQVGKLPGKPGICLWLHRGRHSCDDHAYQGYVWWSAKDCRYFLENRGVLSDLTPKLEFTSTDELLKRLEEELQILIGG